MNQTADYYAEEINRLRDEQRKNIDFFTSVSTNVEKLTHNQQGLSKRLDDLNEKITESFTINDKRIKALEVAEIQRAERKKTFAGILKLWPFILAAAFIFFVFGHILSDTEILKLIVKKWL